MQHELLIAFAHYFYLCRAIVNDIPVPYKVNIPEMYEGSTLIHYYYGTVA